MEKICEQCGALFEGAEQARFCSDAHRKAHARAQAEQETERAEARKLYIEDAVRAARVDALARAESRTEAMIHVKDLEPVDVEARVERARAYAIWRWDAVASGEVAAL